MSSHSEHDEQLPIEGLGNAIRDVIDTYATGHDLPVPLVVGILHCIANEVQLDNHLVVQPDADFKEYLEDDDEF